MALARRPSNQLADYQNGGIFTGCCRVSTAYCSAALRYLTLPVICRSVTLPPIIFARYLDPAADTPIIGAHSTLNMYVDLMPRPVLAAWRAAMITAGVLAALAMNTFVFPKHCRVIT